MLLISSVLFIGVGLSSVSSLKLLNIQVHRCPNLDVYNNGFEDEKKVRNATGTFISSEFDETLRFDSNGTGKIQLVATGEGKFTMQIASNGEKVLSGIDGHVTAKSGDGGVVYTKEFKVEKGVTEASFDVILKKGSIQKTIRVFLSSAGREPPRPPKNTMISSEESDDFFISGGPIPHNETVTPKPEETPSLQVSNPKKNITASESSSEYVEFPSVRDILEKYNATSTKNLRLDSINLNRISKNVTDKYESKTNVYEIKVSQNENGFLVFYVSGKGTKTVTIRSVAGKQYRLAKVMKVSQNYAAFTYTVDQHRINKDRILVKVANDLNEKLFFYVTMTKT